MTTTVQIAEVFKPLFRKRRYKVFFGGRGGGKSWAFAQALLLMGAQRPLRVLCTREFQSSIRESVHKLLSDTVDKLGLSSFYEIQQTVIRGVNGSQFIFEGLRNNVTKIKSMEGIDVVWCEEAEAITDSSWDILIPTIRESGSEIWISFNPDSAEDPTYQRFVTPYLDVLNAGKPYEDETIYVRKVGWRDNPWFPDELRAEMNRLKSSDVSRYKHIWEGECRLAVEGAIYAPQLEAAENENRITKIPLVKSIPIDTFWDLGRNDTTAIWFMQRVGKEHRFVDFYESRLVGLDHYAQMLREKGYFYGDHYLPHDVMVTDLATNRTRQEVLEEAGVSPIIPVPRIKSVDAGIAKVRDVFPSCWFDRDRCAQGLKALRNYQYTFDERYQTLRQTPLHNWASNAADAFRQFAQGYIIEDEAPPTEVGRYGQRTSLGWMR